MRRTTSVHLDDTGLNLYAVIFNAGTSGALRAYNVVATGGVGLWEDYNPAKQDEYAITMVGYGTSQVYSLVLPSKLIRDGNKYELAYFLRSGGSPAQSDARRGGAALTVGDPEEHRITQVVNADEAGQLVVLHLQDADGLAPADQAGNSPLLGGSPTANGLTAVDVTRGVYTVELTQGEAVGTQALTYANGSIVHRKVVHVRALPSQSEFSASEAAEILSDLNAVHAATVDGVALTPAERTTVSGVIDTTLSNSHGAQSWETGALTVTANTQTGRAVD
jgi:hypothetical protein